MTALALRVGDPVPDVPLTWMTDNGPAPASRSEVFEGRRVALFAVPGAFTPTCSDSHLPSVVENAATIRECGIDRIACLSVNDIFVMRAWARHLGITDEIVMLADGAGAWTKEAGLDWDLSALGLGVRSQRFAMIVTDARVEHIAVEQGGSFAVSSGEAMVRVLRGE